MRLEVITPHRLAVETDCDLATLPTAQGEIGVEEGHAYMMATLTPGQMRLYAGDEKQVFAISGGVVDVRPAKMIVLADAVEHVDDIDVERARKAKQRAERRLGTPAEGVDIDRAQAALARAINRIRTASRAQEK